MTSEEGKRPRFVTGGYGQHRRQWVNHILSLLQPFFSSKSYWLLEKSEMINFQILIPKKKIEKNALCIAGLSRFLWRGRHFGICKRLGSSPVKMSQAFHDPSFCSNFLNFPAPKGLKTRQKLLKCVFT